ncbi:MAG: mechanosensitive ion channel family protein, partial [Lachnospiraceae bacterium]|nr:mechanosensitive ion channel family protein [Lachnospiraceae bacterium]
MNFISDAAWQKLLNAGSVLIFALIAAIVGRFVIKIVLKLFKKSLAYERMDPTVRAFLLNFLNFFLQILLVISVISILGVPMATITAAFASCAVAVGLALQGGLSNLAGGIMLMVFRPFSVGDYVETLSAEGTVRTITMFYTVLISPNNQKITIPNGQLMNANVINYSSEGSRRMELQFICGRGSSVSEVQELMMRVLQEHPKVLKGPKPFARISGSTNEALEFTVRAWTELEDYWDTYYDLIQSITEQMAACGVADPSVRITT